MPERIYIVSGTNPPRPLFAFESRELADRAVAALVGNVDVSAGVVDVPLFATEAAFDEVRWQLLRRQALAKLTPEERAALGLEE